MNDPYRTEVGLLDQLLNDQSRCWQQGDRVLVEAILAQQPELRGNTEAILALIRHEIRLRADRGEQPELKEYLGRFPQLETPLRQQFQAAPTIDLDPLGTLPPEPPGSSLPPLPNHLEDICDRFEDAYRMEPAPPSPLNIPGYEILGVLGQGGMGAVYRGRDHQLGREVAVKVLLDKLQEKADFLRRFVEEAKICGQLQHPGVVPVYQLGKLNNQQPYFTMKLVKGQTMAQLLKECAATSKLGQPTQDLTRFLTIFGQVCQAMAYAHAHGVIHRDLKPGNVMVGAFGEVQVMDWGLAKILPRASIAVPTADSLVEEPTAISIPPSADNPEGTIDRRTETGHVLGTPAYMPPEQARGEIQDLDQRCDVFALGSILCLLLTGKPAYESPAFDKARAGNLAGAWQRLDACGADADLIGLARHCLQPKREDRPRDAGAVAAAVTAYQESVQARAEEERRAREVAQARAESERGRAQAERQRRRMTVALAAALLLLLTGASGVGLWYQDEQNRRTNEQLVRAAETEHKRLLAKETIRNALAQAEKPRRDLHAILAKPGGVFRLLNEPARWEAYIQTARNSLKAAQDMLASAEAGAEPGLAERAAKLQDLLDRDEADRVLAEKFEKIRLDRSPWVGNKFDFRGAAERYSGAFAKANLGVLDDPPAAVAARVAAAPIKEQLLAALDDWASVSFALGKQGLPEKLFKIGRLAAPDPAWGDRLRRIELWRDQRTLTKLAKEAPAAGLSASQLDLMGLLLGRNNLARIQWLRQAQAQYPADFWLNFNLGNGLNKSDPAEAAGFFRVALAIRPKSNAAYNNLGNALREQKKLPEAIAAFHKAIEIDPNFAGAYNNLGTALGAQKKLPEAIAAYHKAIEFDPKYAAAYNNLGNALREQKKLPEAIAAFHKAIEFDPNFAPAYYHLGNALYEQKKLPEAIAAFHKAIEFDPKYAAAYNNLGNALFAQKKLPEAIAAYHKAIEFDPKNAGAYNNLGTALGAQKKLPEAIAAFRKAIEFDPNFAGAYYNLGTALGAQKKLPEAIAAFRKAIEFDSNFALAYYGLGNALSDQKKLPEAIAAFHKAIEFDPKYAPAYYHLGNALREQKKLPEAIAAYHKAIEFDPNFANAYNNLGGVLREQKKLPEAIAAFHKAIEFDPNFAGAYYNLGIALFAQKKLPEAIAAYHKVIDLAPGFPEAHCNLGHTLKAQADFAGALKAMEKGHDLGSQRPGWPKTLSEAWVKHCATLLALDKKLPVVLQGERASPIERLALADLCVNYKKHYRDGVRLLETVFREQPALAEDLAKQHRYNAACAAALAAAGRGVDNVKEKEKAPLRRQARDWLQADLDVYAKQVNDGKAAAILQAELRLAHWLTDPDFAGVRDAKALAALPEAEQSAWTKLWGNVALLRKQIRGLITETTFQSTLTDKVLQQVHKMKFETGKTYVIDLKSTELDSYLLLHDPAAKLVGWNDDFAPDNRDARILFTPKETGVYRITATSFQEAGRGGYQLIVRQFGAKPK